MATIVHHDKNMMDKKYKFLNSFDRFRLGLDLQRSASIETNFTLNQFSRKNLRKKQNC